MKRRSICALLAVIWLYYPDQLWSHCEVPCGVYGDDARFSAMEEDIVTIEKAMVSISELAGKNDAMSANQLARWVVSKEEHAEKIQQTVSKYFMTQRIKTPNENDNVAMGLYAEKLVLLHKMLRAAMVCKQSVNVDEAQKLRGLLINFKDAYQKGS